MKSRTTLALYLSSAVIASAAGLPDFKLIDSNPASNRHGGQVSPRDYILQVSGYYFGAAT